MSLEFIEDAEIPFRLPGEGEEPTALKINANKPRRLYRQLVCWCLVQRFWYYVLSSPKVSDTLYDEVERFVAKLERRFGFKNPHSPTHNVGTDNWKMYPSSIIGLFDGCPKFTKVMKGK